jgi:CRISPR-associated protein (TIGR03984 family)
MSTVHLDECALDGEDLAIPGGDLRMALAVLWNREDGVLLGHAYDGLIWGRVRNGRLELASGFLAQVGASLRAETLLDLRVFNPQQELRVWQAGAGLKACRLTEGQSGQRYAGYQDQSYQLLRQPNPNKPLQQARFVVLEGLAGQRHAPPGEPVPRCLAVRHYLEGDPETGLLRIAEHRLLGLEP